MTTRVRFAPSPTGHLHVGNVRTALFNWLYVRKQNGKFILRIEDTDLDRSTKESENIIYEDLKWLGLDWDEGPESGGEAGPYRQSERTDLYKEYTDRLLEEGKAYYCFCSPEELEEARKKAEKEKRPPKYNRKCLGLSQEEVKKRLESGEEATIRFRVPDGETVFWYDVVKGKTEIPTEVIGDQIIVRANGIPRYNYAVVIDDHLMGITHVIRGDDHVPNTPLQLLLFQAFGWDIPKFAHLSMIVGEDHARLSKRHGATSINQFKEKGYLPEALLNYLALLGWSPGGDAEEKMTSRELIDKFSLKKVSSSPGVFDVKKLNWLNSLYIHEKGGAELLQDLLPFLTEHGALPEKLEGDSKEWFERFAESAKTSLVTLADVNEQFDKLVKFDPASIDKTSEEAALMNEEGTKELIKLLADEAAGIPPVDNDKYREMMMFAMKKTERKGKKLFHPFRVALTGQLSGMELDQLVPLLETGSSLELPVKIESVSERLNRFLAEYYG